MDIQTLPIEIQNLIFYYVKHPVADLIKNLDMAKEIEYKKSKNFKFKQYRCQFDYHSGDICEVNDNDLSYYDYDDDDSVWYVQNEWKK